MHNFINHNALMSSMAMQLCPRKLELIPHVNRNSFKHKELFHLFQFTNPGLKYHLKMYSLVKFLTPASGMQGYWDPYPIDMEFRPPCIVFSTIGISKPGKLKGKTTRQCATHLHQLHVCLPSSRQKTRLLYRMSLDFAPFLKNIPFMHLLWRHFAEKVSLTTQNMPYSN